MSRYRIGIAAEDIKIGQSLELCNDGTIRIYHPSNPPLMRSMVHPSQLFQDKRNEEEMIKPNWPADPCKSPYRNPYITLEQLERLKVLQQELDVIREKQRCASVYGALPQDYVHPSALPDSPERDAWIEAEAQYMPGDKLPPAMQGIAPVLPKLGVMAWLRRTCAWMMQ